MTAITNYRFDARRVYADEERYCNGSGLSFFTEDFEQAKSAFETYQRDRTPLFSITVTRCDTGEALLHAGPSAKEAERSMHRAWARRYHPL